MIDGKTFVAALYAAVALAGVCFCLWLVSDSGQRWLDGDHKKPSNK
ncbi:MAG: hypothetical protein LBU03_02415 [Tannerellaceae bacterium]|jgi:hypothetical protein|nr:hypothetical protein [Tannerellaceae bacterium]